MKEPESSRPPASNRPEGTGPPPCISMRGIVKYFGAVRANGGAELEVAPREIHALVGENGAGKSTLMRILAGLFAPDAGVVEVDGRPVTGWSTADAIEAGVGMVHQHFMLVPTLTVAENVVLGREPTRAIAGVFRSLDIVRAKREVQEIGDRFGLRVDSSRLLGDLSVGEAQRVEILKTLFRGARILILDEPTAVLSPPEVRDLWSVLRRLRADGATIVLITHKLDEVVAVSDRITVMRQGETVARMATRDTTPAAIARAMVGREVAVLGIRDSGLGIRDPESGTPTRESRSSDPESLIPIRQSLLSVSNLVVAGARRERAVDGVSFSVAPGEILGIAGVEGNGQTELIEAIAGLRDVVSGTISLAHRDITRLPVRARSDAGLAHIPEDRHRRGLVLDYSVAENLIFGAQHRFTRTSAGFVRQLDNERIAEHARARIARFDIRPPDAVLAARALSGGNQQKIVIAREMGEDFLVLLASQPTRGVDVGAIEFIHARLREARANGKAILLVSAELEEILSLSDRVGVMYGGRLVATLPRAKASAESLGPLMTGAGATDATPT